MTPDHQARRRPAARAATIAILLTATAPARAQNAAPPALEVTGRTYAYNGATRIPAGMFGVHSTPLTADRAADWGVDLVRTITPAPSGRFPTPGERLSRDTYPSNLTALITCLYDRYQPALNLARPNDWRPFLEDLGRRYAASARERAGDPTQHLIEFWNESYLNWATRPGVNYDPRWYDQTRISPGGPVYDRVTGAAIPELVWTQQLVAVRMDEPARGLVEYVGSRYMAANIKPGAEFTWRGIRLRAELRPWARDPGQRSYWSGPYNERLYNEMYIAFARAVKETHPRLRVLGGWGCLPAKGEWGPWNTLYRPMIDAAHPWLDGMHEHHYGGDTRQILASYEVGYAYALTRHSRRLKFYNTEAGGQVDVEQPGRVFEGRSGGPNERAIGAFTYTLRDTLFLLKWAPDKAAARCAHEAHLNGGDEAAFRMLKPLRGALVETSSGNSAVWSVAALEGNRLTVVAFNDHWRRPQTMRLRVRPPTGASLGQLDILFPLVTNGLVKVDTLHVGAVPGAGWEADQTLGVKEARTWIFTLDRAPSPAPSPAFRELQFCSADVLKRVTTNAPAAIGIAVAPDALAAASSAELYLSQLIWGQTPPAVRFNDQPLARPADEQWAMRLPLELAWVKPTNQVVFTADAKGGGLIAACSVVLRRDLPPPKETERE